MDHNFSVSYKSKFVNSKKLFEEINNVINDVINEYIMVSRGIVDYTYNFSHFVEFLNAYFDEELLKKCRISQYDIICDERNNDPHEVRKGRIFMTIKYVQYNCLNWTQLDYTFTNVAKRTY